jgi:hypothetical protein
MREGSKTPCIALALCVAALGATAPAAHSAGPRKCAPVKNPYPDTRYEGVDLSSIRARGVSCATARKVARGAHYKALGITPGPSPIRRLTWHGWKVAGDLRGDNDRYLATKGSARVRWRF